MLYIKRGVLISTYWNVNFCSLSGFLALPIVLISTYWNVNKDEPVVWGF